MTAQQPETEDGNLPQARRHLSDAISRLCDPKPQTLDGAIHWVESFYQQLCDAIPGSQGTRSAVPQSSPPLNIDASELRREIDTALAIWEPRPPLDAADDDPPHITIIRLKAIEKRGWRPQDVTAIEQLTTNIQAWVVAINRLLYPEPQWSLPNPCPACNVAIVHRRNSAAEIVRQPALQISANGCVCQNCRHEWAPNLFRHLAGVLGYEMPKGVLE